jgi:hypothetical protein
MFSLTAYFIVDASSPVQQCSVSHTLFLSVSLLPCSFPVPFVWFKNPGIHFQLIIERNKLIQITSLFHLEVAHNNRLVIPNVNKNDVNQRAGDLGQNGSPVGKLTALACRPSKKVNKAEEVTFLSTNIDLTIIFWLKPGSYANWEMG